MYGITAMGRMRASIVCDRFQVEIGTFVFHGRHGRVKDMADGNDFSATEGETATAC
jgi:hypothetical protein